LLVDTIVLRHHFRFILTSLIISVYLIITTKKFYKTFKCFNCRR